MWRHIDIIQTLCFNPRAFPSRAFYGRSQPSRNRLQRPVDAPATWDKGAVCVGRQSEEAT